MQVHPHTRGDTLYRNMSETSRFTPTRVGTLLPDHPTLRNPIVVLRFTPTRVGTRWRWQNPRPDIPPCGSPPHAWGHYQNLAFRRRNLH